MCRSLLISLYGCFFFFSFGSRASSECRPAGANTAERCLQCQKGQVAAAQVGGATGHPLWHLSDRGLCQRQSDGEDAYPASGGREGESSVFLTALLTFNCPHYGACLHFSVDALKQAGLDS